MVLQLPSGPGVLKALACRFQLERLGYFCIDQDSTADYMIVNRTCTLRDSFPKGQ